MAWTDLLDAILAHKKPLTMQILRGLRDNIIAAMRHEAGAPRLVIPITGNDGTTVTFSGLGDYGGLEATIFWNGFGVADTQTLDVEFSDNGTTWYGTTTLLSFVAQTGNRVSEFWVDFDSTAWGQIRMNMATGGNTAGQEIARHDSGTITGLSLAVTHVRFVATGGSDMAVKLKPNGGIA